MYNVLYMSVVDTGFDLSGGVDFDNGGGEKEIEEFKCLGHKKS